MGDCKVIYEGVDRIKREMKEMLNKPTLTPVEWDMYFKAAKAYKDLLTGCAMEEYEDDWDEESSGRPMRYRMSGEYSGARRRDSMGRFKSGSRYNNGYSGHSKRELLDAYYDMLEEADSDEERRMIKRKINKMEEEM